ncbi:hypothetical protein GCM10027566_19680 [Arachidicoccus ginsenosidivorans]|uniref:RagB/SusD family nutrient uptake outer membrane protein n=1 Tax=Arachidicoccus ginsenosidivorans TaxID=496057 RepID=A0A5B8VMQ9_9BACT|nr:RagB/SusD family nutrient uptake outer membrane protein [Arachidicoccus ginsenosidivorans]QEC72232.1 RagB/SusD family nutrient uptake outer membrane protein [Arachidicoccus ginsenosidivorans]
MKTNKLIYRILFTLLVMSILSCNKYLDKKPDERLVVPESLKDLQELLNNDVRINTRTPEAGETSCDDYFIPESAIESKNEPRPQFYYWELKKLESGGDWSNTPVAIYYANLALEGIKNIKTTLDNKQLYNNVKGCALFIRSYYFLSLLWDYGKAFDENTSIKDLGIMLRTSSDFNVTFKRSSVEDCYDKIIKDTKEAAKLLPRVPPIATRPSKAAAFGLLARTYLSMRDYTNAFLYADSCLKINHTLIDYNQIPESKISSTTPFGNFNEETIFYSLFSESLGLIHYTTPAYIDTILYSHYEPNDLRKTAFFEKDNSGYSYYKGSYTDNNLRNIFTGIATDEMYLIRSECYIRAGKLAEGTGDLNYLLSKRYQTTSFIPLKFSNQKDALARVLLERRKELIYRGLRWIDIKRLNKEDYNIILKRKRDGEIITLQPNSDYYALPFPDNLVRIIGIQQN